MNATRTPDAARRHARTGHARLHAYAWTAAAALAALGYTVLETAGGRYY